ncbi:MAG: hypothetical protein ACYCZY_07960 [Lacisediminihabitans sp.]
MLSTVSEERLYFQRPILNGRGEALNEEGTHGNGREDLLAFLSRSRRVSDLEPRGGRRGAATWLPASTSIHCTYISHQTSVKARYGLWATRARA